jgi:hypothetical protein
MKGLAWYTVIFNLAVVILVLLAATKAIDPPPFSWFESIVWVVLTLPVVIFAIMTMRRPK